MDRDDEKKQLIRDYLETFGTESGKRVIADLEKLALYNQVVQPPRGNDGHIDSYEIVRRDAQRAVVTYIKWMRNKDPYEKKGIKHQ